MARQPRRILAIDPGSASRKYALAVGGRIRLRAHLERVGSRGLLSLEIDGSPTQRPFAWSRRRQALAAVVAEAVAAGLLQRAADLTAVGVRVVAPGSYFQRHRRLTAAYLRRLRGVAADAPLHTAVLADELAALRRVSPRTPVFAISDSAFHAGLPAVSRDYAIARQDTARLDLHRFGYHGLSLAAVVRQSAGCFTHRSARLVVCHLGSGASVTALKNGRSIDTSMGFSPLAGLVMASRVGDIDPGAALYLARRKRLSGRQLADYFSQRSGLRGLSGSSGDLRELFAASDRGDQRANQAVATYAYRIQQYIGAYAAVLGGLDGLVFTGTVGERSWRMRKEIVQGLVGLGIRLQHARNNGRWGGDCVISAPNSRVPVVVISTDELGEIIRQVGRLQAGDSSRH